MFSGLCLTSGYGSAWVWTLRSGIFGISGLALSILNVFLGLINNPEDLLQFLKVDGGVLIAGFEELSMAGLFIKVYRYRVCSGDDLCCILSALESGRVGWSLSVSILILDLALERLIAHDRSIIMCLKLSELSVFKAIQFSDMNGLTGKSRLSRSWSSVNSAAGAHLDSLCMKMCIPFF